MLDRHHLYHACNTLDHNVPDHIPSWPLVTTSFSVQIILGKRNNEGYTINQVFLKTVARCIFIFITDYICYCRASGHQALQCSGRLELILLAFLRDKNASGTARSITEDELPSWFAPPFIMGQDSLWNNEAHNVVDLYYPYLRGPTKRQLEHRIEYGGVHNPLRPIGRLVP